MENLLVADQESYLRGCVYYYLGQAVILHDFQKLILNSPVRYPLGYLHSAPLNIPTIEVAPNQYMCIFVRHYPCQRLIKSLKIFFFNLWFAIRWAIKRTKIQSPTSNYVQLTPNDFAFSVQFRSFRTKQVPPKGNENTTMGVAYSVFPDGIKRVWKNFRVFLYQGLTKTHSQR